MRHVRILGLCFVAVLALGAYLASSASAGLPEFGQCLAKEHGKYANASCTTKAKKGTGTFEWSKSKNASAKDRRFSALQSVTGVLATNFIICSPSDEARKAKCAEGEEELSSSQKVECNFLEDGGEVSATNGKDVKNVEVEFRGCQSNGVPCANGPYEGQINTNALKGELGYLNKSKHEVGVLLEPATKHGVFAKFDCGGVLNISVGGASSKEGPAYSPSGGGDAIISTIEPVNQMTDSFTQKYTYNEETDENIPDHFEGKPNKLLEDYFTESDAPGIGSKWSKAGESIEVTNGTSCEYGSECENEIKA